MSDELVLREDHDGVTVLTLNRPETRNAWTISLQRSYCGRLHECVDDPSVRAIVLTGDAHPCSPRWDRANCRTETDSRLTRDERCSCSAYCR